MKANHTFTVTVQGCTREQAQKVMDERILHDEDYGFDYEVDYESEWTYCECGNRLETPAEYEDGMCEWCYFEKMDREQEEADESLVITRHGITKFYEDGSRLILRFGASNSFGTWVGSIFCDVNGYPVSTTDVVNYNGYTNRELIELELERHQK